MNKPKAKKPGKWRRRLKRWLLMTIAALVLVLLCYGGFRLVYPVWIDTVLPDDAPLIAFSLDNTLLGHSGVTDATYQRVMTAAGGRLIKLRPDMLDEPPDANTVDDLLESLAIDGVLLTGGGDIDPNVYGGASGKMDRVNRLRDDFEIALIAAARRRGLPILGICRGCQILNVAMGGTVRNLRTEDDPQSDHLLMAGHAVDLTPNSELSKLLQVTRIEKVISLHGQAAADPGPGVTIAATGPADVIEAIEADSADHPGWITGIQWHPELTLDDQLQHKVFQTLVDRAAQVRDDRR